MQASEEEIRLFFQTISRVKARIGSYDPVPLVRRLCTFLHVCIASAGLCWAPVDKMFKVQDKIPHFFVRGACAGM